MSITVNVKKVGRSARAFGWKIQDGRIGPSPFGFDKHSIPTEGSRADLLDQTGTSQRVTLTRAVGLGIFALAAKKTRRTGTATVVVTGPEGSITAQVSPARVEAAWLFVQRYNALYGAAPVIV